MRALGKGQAPLGAARRVGSLDRGVASPEGVLRNFARAVGGGAGFSAAASIPSPDPGVPPTPPAPGPPGCSDGWRR